MARPRRPSTFLLANRRDGFVVPLDAVHAEVVAADQHAEDADLAAGDHQAVHGLGGVVDWNGIGLNLTPVLCLERADRLDLDVFAAGGLGVDLGGHEVVLLVAVAVTAADDLQAGLFGQQVDDFGRMVNSRLGAPLLAKRTSI